MSGRRLRELSDQGRWGTDDRLGRLNLMTPDVRLSALALPVHGAVVSLGRRLATQGSEQSPPSAIHAMTSLGPGEVSTQDLLVLSPHGFEMTHLDALGHVSLDGKVYGGHRAEAAFTTRGLRHGGVEDAAGGIVTRGVLLDVAAARGVVHLERGEGISDADLDAAEEISGVTVGSGDAVFVRSGLGRRVVLGGVDTPDLREGIVPSGVEWLYERQVAIYAGDCIERLPSDVPDMPLPLHQVGMSLMGLWMLDNPDIEALAEACARYGRREFLLVVAPLHIPGGTASAVNPLAIF